MPAPIRVKFLARTSADQDPALWLSLFAKRAPKFGDCEFIFDLGAQSYDWLVVYEDLTFLPGETRSNRSETLACARENTLFITTEPTSIKIYGPHYLRQFGHVLSVQPRNIISHPNQIFETPPLRWYYGRPLSPDDNEYIDIDTYAATPPLEKTAQLSAVCSDKQMTPTLKQRYDFTAGLKARLGDDFDWFGRGIRPISDKAEAMDRFRYHIAIENHIEPHHWTEKIADCFLAYCLPFYYGPPNINDYFPKESIIPIDIFDSEGAARIIKNAIDNGEYEKRLPAIIEARKRVLTDYNMMSTISRLIKERHNATLPAKPNQYIYGRHIFRHKHPVAAAIDALHCARHSTK